MADLLFIVWRGADNDQSLWWTNGYWTPPHLGVSYAPYHVGNEGTSTSPALAVYHVERSLVWNGGAGDSTLAWSTYDRDNQMWGGRPQLLTEGADRSPALAVSQDRLFAAWKGVGDDKNSYWTPFDGPYWARPPLRQRDTGTGTSTSNGPAIAGDSARPEPSHGNILGPSQSTRPIPPISPRSSGGTPSSFTASSAPANPPDAVAHVLDGCASAVWWFVVVGIVGALLVPALQSWVGLGQTGERAILSLAVLLLWFGGTIAVFMYNVMKRTDAARP
jgi:hypothetical protein